ncbi:MAG: hypothetical protein Ct9H90mP22_3140 [Gammaproteobacteria bacterium]|nr:MAG: hypothetical protein Ct9H90mP22_3140 [Gammaproteobacteria bacterium]
MGNQARVEPNQPCINLNKELSKRLGDGADVYLASAELAAFHLFLENFPPMMNIRVLCLK